MPQDERQSKEIAPSASISATEDFSRRDISILGALTLLLFASFVLNSSLFPIIVDFAPATREISTYCGVGFSIIVVWGAYRHPVILRETAWSLACLGVFAASLIAFYVGITTQNGLIALCGSPFGGIGLVWFTVLVGLSFTRLGARKALLIILSAFVINYILQIGCSLLLPPATLLGALCVYFVCVAGSYVLMRPSVRPVIERIRLSEAPIVLDVTNPSSFLPFSSPVYVSIFLFNAACGFVFASERGPLFMPNITLAFIPVLIFFFLAVVMRKNLSAEAFYTTSVLLVFAGFLLAPLGLVGDNSLASMSSSILLSAGSDCFNILMYFLIAAVGARNVLGALSTSASAIAASWLGIACGALISQGVTALGTFDQQLTLVVLMLITFVFMTYNFIVMRTFSFDETIRGVRSVPHQIAQRASHVNGEEDVTEKANESGHMAPDDGDQGDVKFAHACEALQERYALTQREYDVLCLLARGRTSTIIQEKLVLSHNTVKTHVRHIYTKLGIHSQQELIDMVEAQV